MCAINGIFRLSAEAPAIDLAELRRTRDAMATRGPDGIGEWLSDDRRVAFGHRRLAIIDPSPAGAQPMSSADGRYHIVFNGEIYNFRELKSALEEQGAAFRSNSDTEVLLTLYAREGESALERLRGMFAFAIWDSVEERMLLARDPFGIKPLYYSAVGGCLRFASQVRALTDGGAVGRQPSVAGLAGFLLWGSVPEPHTFRSEIFALPAGHVLAVERGRVESPRRYRTLTTPIGDPDPTVSLADSVRAHLVSDVPVAVFLSAGLDSSLLAALATRSLPEPPTTLTASFDVLADTPLDEAPLAAATARALGTRHVERRFSKDQFADLWERALSAMDQPSIDGFNAFAISQVARENGFKVVLSGLGGDELFGSYPSFAEVPRAVPWARFGQHVPGLAAVWPTISSLLVSHRPKLAGFFRHAASLEGGYFLRRSLFLPAELPALMGDAPAQEGLAAYDPIADSLRASASAQNGSRPSNDAWLAIHRMESSLYMRNQLLRDADWASMAHSVELRVPLVDVQLEAEMSMRHFEPARSHGKAAMVRSVAPELPEALWRRPKTGFYIPMAEWAAEASHPGPGKRRGLASRELARRVLERFGVELRG